MRWTSIEITDPGTASFAYTTLSGGGALPNQTHGATIRARGTTATGPNPLLKVDNVTIEGSAGFGISMDGLSAGCRETVPSAANGVCQPPIPCP